MQTIDRGSRRSRQHPEGRPASSIAGAETSCELLADLVATAVREGRHADGERALHCIGALAESLGSFSASGIHARCIALLADDSRAEHWFVESLDLLGRTDSGLELAKTHLHYGEWLRRRRRRAEAQVHLTAASDVFAATSHELEKHAARELSICGPASTDHGTALTAQELAVARHAASGATNIEIARELFLSPHTVDYHLRKVFQKLHVARRRELVRVLGDYA